MADSIISEAVPQTNRILICPDCQVPFLNDKNARTSPSRFVYRDRVCPTCRQILHTKQGPEEITSPLCYPPTATTKNWLHVCPNPDCGGKLSSDRDPYTAKEVSDRGFIYRKRVCLKCGMDVHTKQPPEEITLVTGALG